MSITLFARVLASVCVLLIAGAVGAQPPAAGAAREQPPMTNADVIRLSASGLSESIVLTSIRHAKRTSFDISPEALIKLKAARVSNAVISMMQERPSGHAEPTVPAKAANGGEVSNAEPRKAESPSVAPARLPGDVGVYILVAGQMREVNAEIVNWRTGGFLKRMATAGIAGGHVNGAIAYPGSKLQVSQPIEFIFVTPEGTSITEYQLLRLYEKDTRREFRVMSASIIGARSGAEGNLLPFEGERVAPRTYRVRMSNMVPAEYGFLPPGMSGASVTSVGKIYTFSVR